MCWPASFGVYCSPGRRVLNCETRGFRTRASPDAHPRMLWRQQASIKGKDMECGLELARARDLAPPEHPALRSHLRERAFGIGSRSRTQPRARSPWLTRWRGSLIGCGRLREQTGSGAAWRQVALPKFLGEELARHLSEWPPAADGFLFAAPEGGPVRRTNFRRRTWLAAVRASVGEPLRFHDLRHTHAAMLIAQGEHPKVIQLRLGHSSIQVTLDTYGRLFAGLDEAAAERLDATFLRTPADSSRTLPRQNVRELSR